MNFSPQAQVKDGNLGGLRFNEDLRSFLFLNDQGIFYFSIEINTFQVNYRLHSFHRKTLKNGNTFKKIDYRSNVRIFNDLDIKYSFPMIDS